MLMIICTAIEEDMVQDFKEHLNSIEQSIDFTVELECERKLAFLDTEITHHDNGSLTTTVYRKKTNTDKYLSYDLHHPLAQVAKTLFNRAKRICSSFPERVDEEMKVTNALKKNGYPDGMILRNSKFHPEVAQSEKSDEEEQPKATVVLPYIRHVSESIKRILNP